MRNNYDIFDIMFIVFILSVVLMIIYINFFEPPGPTVQEITAQQHSQCQKLGGETVLDYRFEFDKCIIKRK